MVYVCLLYTSVEQSVSRLRMIGVGFMSLSNRTYCPHERLSESVSMLLSKMTYCPCERIIRVCLLVQNRTGFRLTMTARRLSTTISDAYTLGQRVGFHN